MMIFLPASFRDPKGGEHDAYNGRVNVDVVDVDRYEVVVGSREV